MIDVQQAIADIEAAKPFIRKFVPGAAELVVEGGLDVAELILSFVPQEEHEATIAQLKTWLRSGAKAALQAELDRETTP